MLLANPALLGSSDLKIMLPKHRLDAILVALETSAALFLSDYAVNGIYCIKNTTISFLLEPLRGKSDLKFNQALV
jgi:hypothetical protein